MAYNHKINYEQIMKNDLTDNLEKIEQTNLGSIGNWEKNGLFKIT